MQVGNFNYFISTLRLCNISRKKSVIFYNYSIYYKILNILYKEGYIYGYSLDNTHNNIEVFFKYYNNVPLLNNLTCFYKGRRKFYVNLKSMKRFSRFTGLYIFSTSLGILTLKECLYFKVGGILLLKIL